LLEWRAAIPRNQEVPLHGTAWVQFCVTNGDDLVLSGSDWVKVRA